MWNNETIEWLDIELTSFCNISCKGCFRSITPYTDKILNKTYITLDTIKEKFIKEDFPNIKIINFCGSVDEPVTHPNFFEIIHYFSSWGAHINIATNGSLKTTSWWKKLAEALPEKHRVTWGIDGADETSEIYRRGSNFNKVRENFRAFNKAGGKSIWQFIEFEHNQHQTELAKQIAKDEGFVDFKLIISHRKDVNGIKHKKVDLEENQQIICKYAGQKRLFINHMGNVIPCCHLNSRMIEYSVSNKKVDLFEDILEKNDYINDINLKNVSIKEAINGKVFNDIIKSWTDEINIPKCWKTCKQKKQDIFVKEKL